MSTPLTRFDELYGKDPDPWDTAGSWYERRKRTVAVSCLPRQAYASAIEPACGTGELTVALAERCGRLAASDGLRSVVARTRRRVTGYANVEVSYRPLPEDFPSSPEDADLVVLSEILYYFGERDFESVVAASVRALRPGGDLLAVHWRPRAADAPADGDGAHRRLRARPELEPFVTHAEPAFLVDVLRRR